MIKRILIIEDRQEVRDMIADALRIKGWQPLAAPDGEEGLLMATQHLPDLVLCDVEMPKLSGFEVLEKLRAQPATTTIPFIFMTGRAERPQVRQGMSLGADDYLPKPFTIRELITAVETRLNKYDAITRIANERLDQLRSSISLSLPHELRTPLNSILGFSSLLAQTQEFTKEEVKEFAENIYASGLRLERLVENFLLYSQLELAVFQKTFVSSADAPLPAAQLVVSDTARKVADKYNRFSDLREQLEPVSFTISSAYLQKIILELADNAFKFSEEGKEVTIKARRQGALAVIEISDRGCGMTSDQIASIGPHVQFERQTREQQGSGLGLVLARRLTAMHSGSLRVESLPGRGSSAILEFPVYAPKSEPSASPASVTAH